MPGPKLDFRNVNSLWGSVIAETLHRCGVRHAVVSPGSRSTPLAFGFAANTGIEAISVLDERSAGFFALGLARQNRRPTVLVCTSGTAAANFLPAIIEARESGVPLIAITADRPPEMRECSSGQTIDQQKLYGSYPRWQHELASPSFRTIDYLRQTLCFAYERALWPQAGPVHLNAPFRDPLPPVPDEGQTQRFGETVNWEDFFGCVAPPVEVESHAAILEFEPVPRGVIVVGTAQPEDPAEFAAEVASISNKLGWPVLADALSPIRHHSDGLTNLVTTYEFILRNEGRAKKLKPSQVLCIGSMPISKTLRAWLKATDTPTWIVSESDQNKDPLHGRSRHLRISPRLLAAQLPQSPGSAEYKDAWAACEKRARTAIDSELGAMSEMFEGRAAWLLSTQLPEGTPLFVANSMPVRDVDYYWRPNTGRFPFFFNRGASGIDGTLSTAIGIAHGGRPAVLLTGDLALLHDANGFLIRSKFRGSLTIVLINNRGGGIFGHLPVAAFEPPFEEFFATPQDVDFEKLCAAHGVSHVTVRDWAHFTSLVSALPATGIRVLEVRTDRKRDAATRARLFEEVAEALGE